ncbi:MAG: hypothetical protein WC880_04120 [Candidatus Paceibacterota bacterium]
MSESLHTLRQIVEITQSEEFDRIAVAYLAFGVFFASLMANAVVNIGESRERRRKREKDKYGFN